MMTATSRENPSGVGTVTVRDNLGPLQFQGETIADLTLSYEAAAQREYTRWTDITLYRVREDGASYEYVIQVVGRSVVYHRPGGQCHRGTHTSISRLYQDRERYDALEPCAECKPADLDTLEDADTVAVEDDLPTLHRCKDADEVVQVMYSKGPGSRKGAAADGLSYLSVRLLQTASALDENITVALMKTRKL